MPALSDQTLPELFFRQSENFSDKPLFYVKEPTLGSWITISWSQARETIRDFASYLLASGIAAGDRILILSENRPEWGITDLAAQSIGAWSVPLYPSLREEDIRRIAEDCQPVACVVSSAEQLAKILPLKQSVPSLRLIVHTEKLAGSGTVSWQDAVAQGRQGKHQQESQLKARLNQVKQDSIATLIYTSGTTGEPKGVMLSHGNFLSNVYACLSVIPITSVDRHLSFLPLSHVFERMAGWYLMLAAGASIAFAQNIDTVPDDMRAISPTVMLGVPRFFEKLYRRIQESFQTLTGLRRKLMLWSLDVARRRSERICRGEPVPAGLQTQYALARRLVFEKLHKRLGGRLRFFVSGSAPLSKEIGEFFHGIGVTIIEGYGLTETSPVIAVNRLSQPVFGTVGPLIPGVEVSIAADGEILTRGPHIMQGYYGKPQLTEEAIQDGWFHTGDIGYVDSSGRLHITDRKKDLIKTAGGKFVPPQKLEGLFSSDSRISQVIVYGDRKPFCVALVVPNRQAAEAFAAQQGLSGLPYAQLLAHPKVHAYFWSIIEAKQRDLPSFEQVKKIALLDQEFSLASGELTPTLKAKRQAIASKYDALLQSLYPPS